MLSIYQQRTVKSIFHAHNSRLPFNISPQNKCADSHDNYSCCNANKHDVNSAWKTSDLSREKQHLLNELLSKIDKRIPTKVRAKTAQTDSDW